MCHNLYTWPEPLLFCEINEVISSLQIFFHTRKFTFFFAGLFSHFNHRFLQSSVTHTCFRKLSDDVAMQVSIHDALAPHGFLCACLSSFGNREQLKRS